MSSSRDLKVLPLRSIRPHPKNPRFDLGDITDLTEDIRDHGLIEPLVVVPGSWGKSSGECADCGQVIARSPVGVLREHFTGDVPCPGGSEPAGDDWFVLAGHRRRQASIDAGRWDVPCVVETSARTVADQIALMMRENGHRRDLTALEEAHGYEQLTLEGLTATRISQQVAVSRKRVDRRLALLTLAEDAQQRLKTGVMTLEDAESLLDLPAEAADRALASVGTKEFRQDIARERVGVDEPEIIAAELRSVFLRPFLAGAQRPPRDVLPRLRKETLRTLARRLPKRVVKPWLTALGADDPSAIEHVDADRALLALAVAIETDPAGQYDLLRLLGYELSPVEIDLLDKSA